jgi:DNA helicase-2/ATP-dependent DNA helicase PcrA
MFSGASGLFSQPEIKMLVSFLKCLVYTDDNLAFYQLATSEMYDISHDAIAGFYTLAKRENRYLQSLIKSYLQKPSELDFGDSENDKFEAIILDIESYSKNKNDPVGEVLYDYLTEKKYLKKLSENPSVEDELKIHNVAKFFDRIAQFNHSSDERGVLKFLENLELILEVGDEVISSDIDPDIDAVSILTAHASKGLEWPVVFIINCVADRFPSRNKRDPLSIPDELIRERLPEGDFHLQEERRLFYVAATRAKKYLYLTAGEDYGGKRTKKLSQFALELLDEPNPERLKHHLSAEEKIKRFKKVELKPAKLPNKFTGEILKLSRQQIDDYYSCPKKFYYAHVIKIPLLENHYLMYGTAIHAALDHYFSRKISGEKPTLTQLLEDYDQAFRNVGFITRDQEELRKKQGIETLTKFYDKDHSDPSIPSEVEKIFEFCENKVKVNGRYDLVYGTGENSEIHDFKTSDVKEQKDADRRIKDSTQMMIYALAWYEKFGHIPKTTLYFIESGLKGEITFSKKDLDKTKEMIFEVAEGLRKSDMDAKPDYNNCKMCPYKDICPDAV